jgi:hypothetical protein
MMDCKCNEPVCFRIGFSGAVHILMETFTSFGLVQLQAFAMRGVTESAMADIFEYIQHVGLLFLPGIRIVLHS